MRTSWLLSLLLAGGLLAVSAPGAAAARPGEDAGSARAAVTGPVCALYCDTRDPSLAAQETFPVPTVNDNGRLVELHVSDTDGMAWASVDNGRPDDSVWIDRSWDGGSTWDGLLGKASIPSTWTGTRTLMYNLYDPANHRRAVLRACADAQGVACTSWAHRDVCAARCDGADPATGTGDVQPVPSATLAGRTFALHIDDAGMAWATLSGGAAGDEIWLDRSWDGGSSWPDGSSEGRTAVPAGATATRTVKINTDDALGRLYGGAVRACGRAVAGQNGSCTAWARPPAPRDAVAADALMYSYDPNTAYWPSSWWNSAVALATVIDYMRQTGDTRWLWTVGRTFDIDKAAFPAGARSSDPIEGDFISRSTDDSEWWALTWIDAYDLTHDSRYLNEAVTIADYVYGLWDTSTCGGGVWWDRERTYKNAVTNALFVRLTAELHNRIPSDTAWLSRATTAWRWFTGSGLIDSAGLVNDGLTSACANNGQQVWSYNQGLAIGAGVEIWRATGDSTALATARRLADAATGSPVLVTNGVLTESCDALSASCDDNAEQFKGVFMRYLQDLDRVTGDAYGAFAGAQAAAIWSADRTSLNQLGERWSGQGTAQHPDTADWRTQASALSALLAAG
ncbi:Glycosyl hydrolase family 76 [Streptomyces sp. DvalAA-14]|uniref:glycoside hydrolase family 76 protein n=1 Tax=unclassified Streptomyces TaxID=2593676 RepID=UPI00081BA194|nr:glycoside hydrolase family 76 protein [Streptomyces sp. DvalAA-14]SCD60702.1 Glycosyl hydrolase family 76 [Streptomyces sp. DvalAA-14]